MSSRAVPFTAIAGGAVKPMRFVMLDPTKDRTLIQATANGRAIGISGVGTRRYELDTDAAGNLANTGEQFDFFMDGEPCSLVIAGAAVAAGDRLVSNATGEGIKAVAPATDMIGAVALEAGLAGDIIYVLPMIRWVG